MNAAVFFERNGILNLARVEHHQQLSPTIFSEFHLNPDAVDALKKLRRAGFILIATSNQPGLSSGTLSRRELDLMHAELKKRLALHDILICPHHESDCCPCRKPKAGLFFEAAHNWRLNLDTCFVVSDKWQDAVAAHIAGCTSLLIESPWIGTNHHDFVMKNLAETASRILQIHGNRCFSSLKKQIATKGKVVLKKPELAIR